MAKQVHSDVLDFGLSRLRTEAAQLLLLKTFAPTDDYAAVLANAVCTVAVDDVDFAIGPGANGSRVLTLAARNGTASAGSGAAPDLHMALTDGVSKVLLVTDETTNQVITSGNPVSFPSLTYTSAQPT